MSEYVQVQYKCDNCGKFIVIHTNDNRNSHCMCGRPAIQTGFVEKIEGDEIVAYQDEKEVGRRPKCTGRRIGSTPLTRGLGTSSEGSR